MLDYKVQTHEMLDFYEDSAKFGSKDGFHIAAGIVGASRDGLQLDVEDPSFGQLHFVRKTWEPDFENQSFEMREFPEV